MITNNKQHAAAQNKLTLLAASLAQKPDSVLPDIIRETGSGQLQNLIVELRTEKRNAGAGQLNRPGLIGGGLI